jgi:chromosome segregation ATPase
LIDSFADNDLIAEFTGKVSALEQDVMSKDDCIVALNQHVKDLKIKNGDYSRELSSLSRTIDELVESNLNKTEMMVELEKDIATKKNEIVELNDADQAKQLIIATKTEENATLTQELETLKAGNDGLKKSIDELQSRNADYAEEFEHLLSNLKQLVDQNSKLETQVKELIDANEKLSEFESNYNSEVQKNERLTLEHQKMSLSVDKLQFQLQEENMATTQIANRQASLEREFKSAKKLHKQEKTKLMKEMKTAVEDQQRLANAAEAKVLDLESKVERLSKELQDEKDTVIQIAESNAKVEAKMKEQQRLANAAEAKVLDLESKVESLSKELQDEKDTVIQIAESNAKVEAKMKSEKKAAAKESKELANKLEEIESLLAATTVEKDQFQTMYGKSV